MLILQSLNIRRLSEGNLDLVRALSTHSKILVFGLNGPAIGLSAALVGWSDFAYAVEDAFMMVRSLAANLFARVTILANLSLTDSRHLSLRLVLWPKVEHP